MTIQCVYITFFCYNSSETDDSWHVMIQDAILEKCIENGAGVVHIAVDKSSSEVMLEVAFLSEDIFRCKDNLLSCHPFTTKLLMQLQTSTDSHICIQLNLR